MHGVTPAMRVGVDAVAPARETYALSRSFALNGLLFVAVLAVLKLAKPLLVPFVLALFFYFLLARLMLVLGRYRIPRVLTAATVIAIVFGALGIAGLNVSAPAVTWIEEIPNLAPSIKEKLQPLSRPMATIQEAASQVEALAQPDGRPAPEAVRLDEQTVTDCSDTSRGSVGPSAKSGA